jgi:tetratricopeptide (TPR) repeat protein
MCAIARGLMNRPPLMMIDELSLGLAPVVVDEVADKLPRRPHNRLIETYETLGDRVGAARVRYGIGEIHRMTGRYNEALTEGNAALDSFRQLGDRLGEADTLNSIGGAHLGNRDFTDASRLLDETRTMYEELHDRQGEARALRGMAELARQTGHSPDAVAHLRRALTLLESLELPEADDVRAEITRIETDGPPDR